MHIAGGKFRVGICRSGEEDGRGKGGMRKGRGNGKVTGENGAVLLYGEMMVCGVDEGNGTEG